MKEFFLRLFGIQRKAVTAQQVMTSIPATDVMTVIPSVAQADDEELHWQIGKQVEREFESWLLKDLPDVTAPHIERTILSALDRLVHSEMSGSHLIPRVPSVLPQILKGLRDTNTSAAGLAQQIAKDVVLVAELMHEVNGAYYHPTTQITSLDHAIQILGFNGLRMLIARTAFRPLIQSQSGTLTKLLAPVIWEHSDKCALAAQILARQRNTDEFHAFLAGLLQNVGLIIALRTVDQTGVAAGLPHSPSFLAAFFSYAGQLSCIVGTQWEFPEDVIHAVSALTTGSRQRPLDSCLRQADQLAKIQLLINAGQAAVSVFSEAMPPNIQQCFYELNQRQG